MRYSTVLHRSAIFAAASGMIFTSETAFAQMPQKATGLEGVYECASKSDDAERLACYDQAVGRLKSAESSGELVAVTREDVQAVERDAFGFSLPSLPRLRGLFGGGDDSEGNPRDMDSLTAPVRQAEAEANVERDRPRFEDVDEIVHPIAKTTSFGYKKTRFFLANGQVWDQVSPGEMRIPRERNGETNRAEIRRAALGSYLLQINGEGEAIRVRRRR